MERKLTEKKLRNFSEVSCHKRKAAGPAVISGLNAEEGKMQFCFPPAVQVFYLFSTDCECVQENTGKNNT